MKFFQFLNDVSKERELPFLLIGGIAVNLYGYSRDTHDVDLLVRRSQKREWENLALSLGYSLYREEQAFAQFTPEREPAAWPLDLMLIRQSKCHP